MSEPTVPPTAPVVQSSFWGDAIEVLFQPAGVFRRRQFASAWPPAILAAVAIGVIFYLGFDAFGQAMDAEFSRNAAKMVAKNPRLTPEILDRIRGMMKTATQYSASVMTLFTIFAVGCTSWLLGKILESKQSFHAALVVAAWSYMPRILGTAANAAIGLTMDPAQLTSLSKLTASPAYFMNVERVSPILLHLAARFDLFTLWGTLLLAVGFYVTGQVSKRKAALFGVIFWTVASVVVVLQALRAS